MTSRTKPADGMSAGRRSSCRRGAAVAMTTGGPGGTGRPGRMRGISANFRAGGRTKTLNFVDNVNKKLFNIVHLRNE